MATPESIASFLLRGVNRAVREYELIADGDRVLVGVSGGKDSRALLDLLVRGIDIPGRYEVFAVHVDGSAVGLPDQVEELEPWFQALGVTYEVTRLDVADDEKLPMDCFRCSWNRRKALFLAADRFGCNKVALGHHADDAAVTTLMSLMYKGRLETLEPRRSYFGGRLHLIRPLILLSEAEIWRLARASGWSLPTEPSCPQGVASRRARIEAFLGAMPRRERAQIRTNLRRAVQVSGYTEAL
ncbi:MAG: tRNA 2-thiocytidine(32) synthetase TtcA [Anaerolineae bacterium]|nr:tRNA 2-thiocytidine(32) synthetase TtcA [Anaerolineae bacterium]